MIGVDPRAFEAALGMIKDGFVFEDFAKQFLSKVLGYSFIPVGGIKDRAIDGLSNAYTRANNDRTIYQISIEKNPESKMKKTLDDLKKNKINYEQFFYVTNQSVHNKDIITDQLYDIYKKNIHIFDVSWFSSRVNDSEEIVTIYNIFIDSYMHEFSKPGKSFEIADLVSDPRLFVFLRQQWDENRNDLQVHEILADTLIMYALEDTDPEQNIFKTRAEIKQLASKYVKFDPRLIYDEMDRRLNILCIKPRKITYHSTAKAYCLPFETRKEITDRNILEARLYEDFMLEAEIMLKKYIAEEGTIIRDYAELIKHTINKLFYQQGFEFSNFVLNGENKEALEKDLPEIIRNVVEDSRVVVKNRDKVKNALLITIRSIVYDGSESQKNFLRKFSNTYMMLFLLQCEPKIATFFSTMANKLNVYVCTSIIIPALSEYYLAENNRRHWILLTGANKAGVKLIVNDTILDELVSHFRHIIEVYNNIYKDHEDIYLSSEENMLYVEEIMIRSYFYAKFRNKVDKFEIFIDSFVNPSLVNAKDGLIEWLKEEFGIIYRSDRSLNISKDADEEEKLYQELRILKDSNKKARRDSNLILTIYSLREKNNETNQSGIFGYRTWWLSKDTLTQRAVNKVFSDKYSVSCYIRPDFLYNYIALSPSKAEVDEAYNELFPSLLGVNISFRLPREVIDLVNTEIRNHRGKNTSRLKSMLRELSENIKSDPKFITKQNVKHYLDDRRERLSDENGIFDDED